MKKLLLGITIGILENYGRQLSEQPVLIYNLWK